MLVGFAVVALLATATTARAQSPCCGPEPGSIAVYNPETACCLPSPYCVVPKEPPLPPHVPPEACPLRHPTNPVVEPRCNGCSHPWLDPPKLNCLRDALPDFQSPSCPAYAPSKDNPLGCEDTCFAEIHHDRKCFGRTNAPCDYHDACYDVCYPAGCWAPGQSPKEKCDKEFYDRMLAVCAQSTHRFACELEAETYYLAVKVGADVAYDQAQRRVCRCCP
jgi:hypothetical protein